MGVLIFSFLTFLLVDPIWTVLQHFQVDIDLIPSLDKSPGTVVR